MSKIPYACLYSSYEGEMTLLEDVELGRLLRALMHYQNSGEELALSGPERYLWQRVKLQHDRDAEHYDEVCDSRSKAAKKRWSRDAKVQMQSLDAKEIENEKEKEKEKEKELSLLGEGENIFPSLEDVIYYVQEAGLNFVDAQHFTDYYTSVGWVCGDKPMKDWKAMVRLWDKRAQKDAANAPKPAEEVMYGNYV